MVNNFFLAFFRCFLSLGVVVFLCTPVSSGLAAAATTTSTTSSSSSSTARKRYYLVTGANKGQGFALCQRILNEYPDTHVFLCARTRQKGLDAANELQVRTRTQQSSFDANQRMDVIPLDVTCPESVQAAVQQVQEILGDETNKLDGLVSNAGILWGHSLQELLEVCATGVKRVLDGFLPLVKKDGTVIVVSSGLSPLMLAYSKYTEQLQAISSWKEIEQYMDICLQVETEQNGDPVAYQEAGFPGGPFAESVPDFHRYGLAKMFADAYMLHLSRQYPEMSIHSADPGLVYTDLIGKMPKYQGKPIEDTGAKTPEEGVEVHMRLLFGPKLKSGQFHAIDKAGALKSGPITQRPDA